MALVHRLRGIFLLCVIILSGCTGVDSFTQQAPGLALPEAALLNPIDIYNHIAPSIAYVETDTGSGSGVLLKDRYVLTNAHVVWPAEKVRVVFPDGSEFSNVTVVNTDLITDLAILGPLKTNLPGLTLTDGEDLPIGSSVYLIGYPGEYETFPQPAITGGLISRYREWESFGQTYFQTDAAIAGGQSGGVLVSDTGEVIGISGNAFTEADFGLAASFADNAERIDQLIAGQNVDLLATRPLPDSDGDTEQSLELQNYWEVRAYIVNVPAWTEVEVELTGDGDAEFHVVDPFSEWILTVDDEVAGGYESDSFVTEIDAPYYILVDQFETTETAYELTASEPLMPVSDPDDGQELSLDQTLHGQIDHPGDVDYYLIDLDENETVRVTVDSLMIDPYLTIDFVDSDRGETVSDDTSWGSFFQAELVYTAATEQQYLIVVQDSSRDYTGGYKLSISAGE